MDTFSRRFSRDQILIYLSSIMHLSTLHLSSPDGERCRIPASIGGEAVPSLGKAPRVPTRGRGRRLVHRARFPSVSIGIGRRRELNLEVTGPVITSRRVGGKFRLPFSALRDVAMQRFVPSSRLPLSVAVAVAATRPLLF